MSDFCLVGEISSTEERKLYHKDCMVTSTNTEGDEVFALDFKNELKIQLKIDKTLQIELYKNLVIKLYTKYPKIKKYADHEEQPDEPEVTIVQELLGFCVVRLEDFLNNPDLKEQARKYNLFEYESESVFKNSEIYWPLPDESTILQKNSEKINAVRLVKYTPKKEEESTVVTDKNAKAKPGAKKPVPKKKPVKKPAPKKTTGGKGQEEEAPKVDILDWQVDSRTAIAYKDDFLGREDISKNPHNKFLVSGGKKLAIKVTIN